MSISYSQIQGMRSRIQSHLKGPKKTKKKRVKKIIDPLQMTIFDLIPGCFS